MTNPGLADETVTGLELSDGAVTTLKTSDQLPTNRGLIAEEGPLASVLNLSDTEATKLTISDEPQ